jgi:hypothetical protein
MTPTVCPLQSQRPGWGWLSLCSARLGPCGGCARCPPRRTSARTDSRGKCLRLQFTSFRSPVPRRRGLQSFPLWSRASLPRPPCSGITLGVYLKPRNS